MNIPNLKIEPLYVGERKSIDSYKIVDPDNCIWYIGSCKLPLY